MQGRSVLSGIRKRGTPDTLAVGKLGLQGDEQADLDVHGGLRKAVYAFPSEHYPWWQQQRAARGAPDPDQTLPWGFLGENLTLQGLTEADIHVGD